MMKKPLAKNSLILLLIFLLAGNLALPFIPAQQPETLLAIVGATIIDGSGAEPFQGSVLIRGDRIAEVGKNITLPPNTRMIRAEGLTLIPGLFDLHTHLSAATGGNVSADWGKHLKAYLYCGVTSVVDFGTYPETFEPMRRLIRSGQIIAPRLSLAARITTPGGHGAEGGRGDFFSQEVTTPQEARAAVARVLPYHPDVIKVFTDGWRYGTATDMTSMNEDTLTAICDAAHQNGIEVLTHTVTLEKAKIAARAGVDVLAHGVGNNDIDEELIQLLKQHGTSYVSTLAVYEPRPRYTSTPLLDAALEPAVKSALQNAPPSAEPPQRTLAAQAKRWKYLLGNIAILKKAGINIGDGTDSGITGTHHGWATLREIKLLVQGGLSPLEALTAATGGSAKALKVEQERGTITPGKLADLVLINGAPHQNINDIEKIKQVFLGGRALNREQLASDIASTTLTAVRAIKAQEVIDDFERADGRSTLDTLWIINTDPTHDHSTGMIKRALRDKSSHIISAKIQLSEVQRPYFRLIVPLSRGAVEPVDASAFHGLRFEVRGSGSYRLLVATREVRSSAYFQAPFQASSEWTTVSLDFTTLKQEGKSTNAWTGKDLQMVMFEVARKPGESAWLELDNLKFYR
jgi:imidazolonepropionase-like amidohydrolase